MNERIRATGKQLCRLKLESGHVAAKAVNRLQVQYGRVHSELHKAESRVKHERELCTVERRSITSCEPLFAHLGLITSLYEDTQRTLALSATKSSIYILASCKIQGMVRTLYAPIMYHRR